jgi:hypothetical protein
MKKYTFELIIKEGGDEFWEGLGDKTGCEEVTEIVKEALGSRGFDENDSSVVLKRYELEN